MTTENDRSSAWWLRQGDASMPAHRLRPRWPRPGSLFLALAALFAGLAWFGAGAGATPGNTPPPITDYANYPMASLFPAGCNADGTTLLTGVLYSVARAGGGTETAASLRAF